MIISEPQFKLSIEREEQYLTYYLVNTIFGVCLMSVTLLNALYTQYHLKLTTI